MRPTPGRGFLLGVGLAITVAFLITRLHLSHEAASLSIIGILHGVVLGWTGAPLVSSVIMLCTSGLTATHEDKSAALLYLIACAVFGLRLYYYPIHALFFIRLARRRYWFHPVISDETCCLPFPRLDHLIADFATLDCDGIVRLIKSLESGNFFQKRLAVRTQIILAARAAMDAADLTAMLDVVTRLPAGTGRRMRRDLAKLRQWLGDLSSVQARLNTISRPAFREPVLNELRAEIVTFQHRVRTLCEPIRAEFDAASKKWVVLVNSQIQTAKSILQKEPLPQVFAAGNPIDRISEAFVTRSSALGDLEKLIVIESGSPGIVLYGRRRMGKSTILRNLSGTLPDSVVPVVVSMQDPEAFTSEESFVSLLVSRIGERAPIRTVSDIHGLYRMLQDADNALKGQGKRLLIAIDEYELIDERIGDGLLPAYFLHILRESIQCHRNLAWVFAGSHSIEELTAAPWTSFLVSARTVDVEPFTLDETMLLLTEPLRHSTLWPINSNDRPRFPAAFWGHEGIRRIHRETGGWPHLLQLTAGTIVDLANDSGRRVIDEKLIERALEIAVSRGHNVFYELLRRECVMAGEWEYLSRYRDVGEQPPPNDPAIAESLRRRLLVETGTMWRLRVPLMRRWLTTRF
jgi:hypothetical protein